MKFLWIHMEIKIVNRPKKLVIRCVWKFIPGIWPAFQNARKSDHNVFHFGTNTLIVCPVRNIFDMPFSQWLLVTVTNASELTYTWIWVWRKCINISDIFSLYWTTDQILSVLRTGTNGCPVRNILWLNVVVLKQ